MQTVLVIDDDAYLAQLQEIFDANDAADGIDRHDGYGRDWRITGLAVAGGEDGFDDIEVAVAVAAAPAGMRSSVRTRVLFDRQWRHDAGYEDPAVFAPYVVREIDRTLYRLVREDATSVASAALIDPVRRDALWTALLEELGDDDVVAREVAPGTIEVEELDEPRTWVHLTRDRWADYVAENGWDQATEDLSSTRSALWEEHTVLFRGSLCASVRAELPPVSQAEDDRANGIPPEGGRMAGGYWVAVDSEGREHRFPEMPDDERGGLADRVLRVLDRLRRR